MHTPSAYDPLKVKRRLYKSKSIQKFYYDHKSESGPRPALNLLVSQTIS